MQIHWLGWLLQLYQLRLVLIWSAGSSNSSYVLTRPRSMAPKTERSLLVIGQSALEGVSVSFSGCGASWAYNFAHPIPLALSRPVSIFPLSTIGHPNPRMLFASLRRTVRPSELNRRVVLLNESFGISQRGEFRKSKLPGLTCAMLSDKSLSKKCNYTRTSPFISNQAYLLQGIRIEVCLQFIGNL